MDFSLGKLQKEKTLKLIPDFLRENIKSKLFIYYQRKTKNERVVTFSKQRNIAKNEMECYSTHLDGQ